MRIGIDGRLISQTGVGVYIRNLLFYLSGRLPRDWQVYIYLIEEDYKKASLPSLYIKRRCPFLWHTWKEQLFFLQLLNKDNLDLMHFTYFTYPVLYKKPFLATIHDLTPLFFKTGKASTKNRLIYEFKHLAFRLVLSSQVKKAQRVITPSKTVKNQLIKVFGTQYRKKIKPIYEGIDFQLTSVNHQSRLKEVLVKPFFLYVGNFYPHKNVNTLIKAFNMVRGDVTLVLAGPDDFFAQGLKKLVGDLKQQKRVIFLSDLKRRDFVFLYQKALALIQPSLSEGFGLSVLEALYFGCPVIASKIKVFEEVYGDSFIPFDPYKTDQLVEKMNFFVKAGIKQRIKKRVNKSILRKFSFDQMAKKTLDLYREIVSK